MPSPRELFLCWPPEIVGVGTSLKMAHLLTEYDVIYAEPTIAGLWQKEQYPRFTMAAVEQGWADVAAELAHRREEIQRFFRAGGLFVCLLAPEGGWLYPTGDSPIVGALELLATRDAIAQMGLRRNSGESLEVISPTGVFSHYLGQRPPWQATLRRGLFAADPLGFPLAVAADGSIVAYVELVDAGMLAWVPMPLKREHWISLQISTQLAWREREEAVIDVVTSEQAAIQAEFAAIDQTYAEQRTRLLARSQGLHNEAQRFLVDDEAVTRARSLLRASRVYGPQKALVTLHDMLETIEQQYGGEAAARRVLGYSAETARRISAPANDRRLGARHPGTTSPATVPPDVLESAAGAAKDILGRFTEHRFKAWREAQGDHQESDLRSEATPER